MSRFVVADVADATDAKSIPQELLSSVPHMPSVPVRPIIAAGQLEYSMFEHFKPYPWVLPVYQYTDRAQLLANIVEAVVTPVLAWETNAARKGDLAQQVQAQQDEMARLRAAALEAKGS